MASQDELIVRIGADFNELKKGLKKAGDEVEEFGKKGGKAGKKIGLEFEGARTVAVGLAGGIGLVTTAIGLMTKGVLENAKAQRLWAKRLTVNEETFGALSAVARRFGAETDDMGDAIKDLNERIADASRGNKTYETALNMVGLASKDLINLPVEDQFIKVADAIGKMTNAGDQNFATQELMADAGFRLAEVFRLGEDGIRKMADEVIRTNEAMSAFELKKIAQASRHAKELDQSFQAMKNTIANETIEALMSMTSILKDASEFWGEVFNSSNTELGNELVEINKKLKEQDALTEKTRLRLKKGLTTRQQLRIEEGRGLELANKRRVIQMELNALEAQHGLTIRSNIDGTQRQLTLEESIIKAKKEGRQELGPSTQQLPAFMPSKDALGESIDTYQSFLEEKAKLEEEARNKELNDAFNHAMDLGEIEAKKNKSLEKMEDMKRKGQATAQKQFFADMTSLMGSSSRKMFEIGKAFAMAEVGLEIPKNAEKAWGWGMSMGGPPLAVAFAGASVASGLARLQQISSTSMGGGGGGASGGGAGAGVTGGADVEQQAPQNVVDATFNIQGSSVGADQIRQLGSDLNELAEDGFVLRSVSVN